MAGDGDLADAEPRALEKQASASGTTAERRSAFMPCVSETLSPNKTRRITLNAHVATLRKGTRVSVAPTARFEPTTIAGPPGSSTSVTAASRNSRSK